jgi:hypothetical protein
LKGWLLSDSTGTQVSVLIATGCFAAFIATLLGEELSLDTALALSGLIVAASLLDTLRACARRDPVYGFSLGWKGALVLLFVVVAMNILTVVQVVQKSWPVSELWQANYKTGLVELGISRVFRLTDPKGY